MLRFLFALICCACAPASWANIMDINVPMNVVMPETHSHFVQSQPDAAFNEVNRANTCSQPLRLEQERVE